METVMVLPAALKSAALLGLLFPPLAAVFPLAEVPAKEPAPRRIALRISPRLQSAEELRRLTAAGERRGLRLDVGDEEKPVPAGWEALRVGVTPPSAAFSARLARFPVRTRERAFSFDGREYSSPDDGIALSAPGAPSETLVLGNSPGALRRLTGSILRSGSVPPGSYRVVAGELRKEGTFTATREGLAVDRASDRDEISERERFFRDLRSEKRGSAAWRYPASTSAVVARWQRTFDRSSRVPARAPVTVVVFPDTVTKARYTGSSRPADLSRDGASARLELDASAAAAPDLISPALAAAAAASRDPRLLDRPLLLLAEGARRHGRWWGREVAGFGSFTGQAGVAPSIAEVLSPTDETSPVLAVGTAASWLHAGASARGEEAVRATLIGPGDRLAEELDRWSKLARAARVTAPRRRPLPRGFLRGVSYAMTNGVESSYASPRSLETLRRLSQLSVNSISIMPFAWSRTPTDSSLSFIHRHPAGETDEGTVAAVSHARQVGMSALLKPHIWIGRGTFVGEIAMTREEDWRAWFAAYRRFIVHHAVVGEAAGVDLFCVGTELAGTESREKQWREVIAAARLATGVPLLYASNWAAGAPEVPFWDALDAIGVDFYDPLSTDAAATDAALRAGVRRAFAPLSRLAARHRLPVIFAEAGYPPVRSAWLTPHDEATDRPLHPEDAARAITAVLESLENERWWKGVYWWKVFSEGLPARPGSRDFNILGRPAERAVAEAYGRIAREEGK